MSSIYFHSANETVSVHGSERAHFGILCTRMAWGVIGTMFSTDADLFKSLFPPDNYIHSYQSVPENMARIAFECERRFVVGDDSLDGFTTMLNTALFMGSDPVKLAARIHGQCEIHAYVMPAHFEWLAGIIKQGRSFKLYRDNQGWEDVLRLFEEAKSPIVLSYSVTDSFPNSDYSDYYQEHGHTDDEDDEFEDAWYAMDRADKFHECFNNLSKLSKNKGLEISPENWDDYYFGHGVDVNKLVALLYERQALSAQS